MITRKRVTSRGDTRGLLALALVCAMGVSTIRFGVILWSGVVRGSLTWAGPDLAWMAPLGSTVFFCAVMLVVMLGQVLLPRQIHAGVASWIIIFGASMLGLVWFRGLHPFAVVALSLGIAQRCAPAWVSARRPWRVAGVLAAVVVMLALVVGGRERLLRRADRDSVERGHAGAGAPNVLLIVMDVVRARSTSLHGYGQPTTPRLEALGREGTVFDGAYSVAPWTLLSHASMFTGRWHHELGAGWRRPLGRDVPTLAEQFRSAGYRTGGFVGNLYYTSRETGLGRGFETYDDFHRTWRQVLMSTTPPQIEMVRALVRHPAAWWQTLREFRWELGVSLDHDRKSAFEVSDAFLRWQRAGTGPFFAFLNYYDAHTPYRPPPPYDTLFPVAPMRRDQYEGAIRYVDSEIGRVLDSLRQRGVLDSTIVLITGDHGELFGEHGVDGHGNALYDGELRVPLVLRYPARVAAGTRIDRVVSLRDLGATLADLAGVSSTLPGLPWSRTPSDSTERHVVSAGLRPEAQRAARNEPIFHGPMQAAMDGAWLIILQGNGHVEAFDLARDPDERVNRGADTLTNQQVRHLLSIARTNAALDARMAAQQ